MAEPAIRRLGTFLADLTHDKPPDQIHQEILDRLRDPEQELDHRLAGIYLHVKDFVPIWTAIRNGASLPASSWETVVLPAVVHFSPPQHLKSHLEAVTSLFLNARGNREIAMEPTPAPVYEPEPVSLLDSIFDDDIVDIDKIGKADRKPMPDRKPVPVAASVKPRRRWVPQAAAVAIVALAGVAIWTSGPDDKPGGTSFAGLPKRPPVTVPTEPSASPSAEPQASGSPVPGPVPGSTTTTPAAPPQSGPPSRIPGAPTGLSASNIDGNSVTLSWRAPAPSTNVAYYKIFQDGAAIGQLTGTTDDAVNLRPATTYTFVVRAYNQTGEQSPPSNSLTVSTVAPALVFDVPSSVAFGSSFGLGGSGWLCSDVTISIAGEPVEIGKVDEYNSFDAQITVRELYGSPGWVDILNSSQSIHLTPGDWTLTASCPGGQSKFATLTVTAVPAVTVSPSEPPPT